MALPRRLIASAHAASPHARQLLVMRLAAVLFVGGGILALVSLPTVPRGGRLVTIGVGLIAAALGVYAWRAPWASARWARYAVPALAPVALALVGVVNVAGNHEPYDYAVFYVIVHAWVGLSMPRGTSLVLAPMTAVTYVLPLTVIAASEGTAIASALVVVPACVLLGEGIAWLVAALDSSEHTRRELALALAAVEAAALHDDVTGLANRAAFYDHLDVAMSRCRRTGERLLVCSLDLDKFKLVNDTLGHVAGDELLREAARRLREALREGDVVARVGGDEFLILLPADDTDPDASSDASVVRRIREALDPPVRLKDMDVYVSASVGTATFPVDGADVDALLQVADAKMYRQKRERSAIGIVEHQRTPLEDELRLATRLRRSADRPAWDLRFQPIVELVLGRAVGAEALIRWHDPDHGLRSPAEFLPLIDELDLGPGMTRWIFEQVATTTSHWSENGMLDDMTVLSVNLSPRELWHPSLPHWVRRLVSSAGRPDVLVIEVTEEALTMDLARASSVLADCRRSGVRIALDDFGTGYSSLARLRSLPIDIVKVDRSFLAGVDVDASARSLLRSIVRLISDLDMVPVAEGIETERHLEVAMDAGFSLGQGFLLGPPVHADRFGTELRDRPQRVLLA